MPKNHTLLNLKRRCRGLVRRAAIEAAAAAQQGLGGPWFDSAARAQLLLLHGVERNEAAAFRRLIGALAEHFEFISYSDAARRALAGPIDRPLLAFSFDDGLASCSVAAGVLEEYGARACFFVCPWVVDGPPDGELARFCHERLWHGPRPFLGWREVERLVASGHEVGGHTLTHPDLSTISPGERRDEVGRCREALLRRLGKCDHFAWPYGRFHHLPAESVGQVFGAGYLSCASGERGSHAPWGVGPGNAGPHAACLRRESVRASWPLRHIAYFLNRSARTPLALAPRSAVCTPLAA